MLDVLIIGAGITGVTIGRLLQMRGINNVLIIEAASQPGGLCRTESIGGHVLDIGGGHFLCSKYPEVYSFIFEHMPVAVFNKFDRVSKVHLKGKVIDYPIEVNIWQLPVEEQIEYLLSLFERIGCSEQAGVNNYEEWIRSNLGSRIADDYMLPYNQKLWGLKASDMDVDWLAKIPQLNTREILRSCLNREADRDKMPSHASFYYPKQGGFQEIFDAIYAEVKPMVRLNEPAEKLSFHRDFWSVNGIYEAKTVITTAPWPDLFPGLGRPPELENCFAKLKSNSIVVSLWEKEYAHDWHWCYYPDEEFEYHREFYIKNFAPHSSPDGLYTETNVCRWHGSGQVWQQGAKPVFEYVNKRAYPIPVLGHGKARRTILDFYETKKLYGAGRWGRWEYLNADVCIWEAMRLVERIFSR